MYLDINKEALRALTQERIKGPIQMLNLLKFKKQLEAQNISGREYYTNYMKAAYPFFLKSKATIVYNGKAIMTLVGPDEEVEWDKIIIVEYPSKDAFLNMVTSPGYPAKLRRAALEDSRLILLKSKEKA